MFDVPTTKTDIKDTDNEIQSSASKGRYGSTRTTHDISNARRHEIVRRINLFDRWLDLCLDTDAMVTITVGELPMQWAVTTIEALAKHERLRLAALMNGRRNKELRHVGHVHVRG